MKNTLPRTILNLINKFIDLSILQQAVMFVGFMQLLFFILQGFVVQWKFSSFVWLGLFCIGFIIIGSIILAYVSYVSSHHDSDPEAKYELRKLQHRMADKYVIAERKIKIYSQSKKTLVFFILWNIIQMIVVGIIALITWNCTMFIQITFAVSAFANILLKTFTKVLDWNIDDIKQDILDRGGVPQTTNEKVTSWTIVKDFIKNLIEKAKSIVPIPAFLNPKGFNDGRKPQKEFKPYSTAEKISLVLLFIFICILIAMSL